MIAFPTVTEVNESQHNIVDLFSGVGGLSLGAARAGFTISCAVELEPRFVDAHARNFPKTDHLTGDVSYLNGETLKSRLRLGKEKLAGLIGGPPCQGFSTIGKRSPKDTRNELFVEFFRMVAEVQPKFFLAENVPGILREEYSKTRAKALSYVEQNYEMLPSLKLAANEYGAPTTRERIFFFGYLRDELDPLTSDNFNPPAMTEQVHVRDAFMGLPIRIDSSWQKEEQGWQVVHAEGEGYYAQRLHGHIPSGVGDKTALERLKHCKEASGFLGTSHSDTVAERYANTECGKYDSISKSYRLDPDGFCPTLRAGTGPNQGSFQAVRPIHPTEARVITPREAARLQGFPDWFQFSSTKWHSFRQIGNSVSPILAEHIFSVIANSLGIRNRERDIHG